MRSKVLIVTICSNTKSEAGQTLEYQASDGIAAVLPDDATRTLFARRRRVLGLITGGQVSRDGKALRAMPYNESLVTGPDFQAAGQASGGMYLPAIERYDGRFYTEIGSERLATAQRTEHHLLILSGLYGLVTPTEPIQCYSCHASDHADIHTAWTEDSRLTDVLVAYIEKAGITKVFDFTAADVYRNLIAWEMVRRATSGNVLHCFSKQFAGPALLRPLGAVTKKFLEMSEAELLAIKPGHAEATPYKEVLFESVPVPDERTDVAREIRQQVVRLNYADQIGRMRRNMIRIMDRIPGPHSEQDGFTYRAGQLKGHGLDYPIAKIVLDFAEVRNRVEHELYQLSKQEWLALLAKYKTVETWANTNGYVDAKGWEKIVP